MVNEPKTLQLPCPLRANPAAGSGGAASFRSRGRSLLLFLLLLPLAVLPETATAGPTLNDALGGDNFLEEREKSIRQEELALWTKEITAGITDLRSYYITGGEEPPIPAVALQFLLFKAHAGGPDSLTDLALATAAVWYAMSGNDYVKSGIEVAPGVYEKRAAAEARLLLSMVDAYRASGKAVFKNAAVMLGDDLAKWAAGPSKDGVGILQVIAPASVIESKDFITTHETRGPGRATRQKLDDGRIAFVYRQPRAVEGSELAAALLQAGLVFGKPDWLKAARGIAMNTRKKSDVKAASNPLGRFEAARQLIASIDAAAARPHASWKAAPRFWADQVKSLSTRTETPLDPMSGGWAALALMRWSVYAHDDSAAALALRLLDALSPPEKAPDARNPDLFQGQAAAALALQMHLAPVPMAYIVADPRSPVADSLVTAALSANRPGRLVALHSPAEPDLLYPGDPDGGPIVYVCSGELCAPPVNSPADVKDLLQTFALPGEASDAPGTAPPSE